MNTITSKAGQSYQFAGEETITRVLFRWRSRCAHCGAVFEFNARDLSRTRYATRRCRTHRRPGVRVQPRG